jgi:predicted RNA-binding protein associated with RNAse of E/G family
VVDEEELADAVAAEQVPDAVAEKARTVAARVADAFAE